jgi:hypothetical protein
VTDHLAELIERARSVKMTKAEKEAQRNSFAYGNAGFENPRITRQMVEEQAKLLKAEAN